MPNKKNRMYVLEEVTLGTNVGQKMGQFFSDFTKLPSVCIDIDRQALKSLDIDRQALKSLRHRPIVFIGNQGTREYASCFEYLIPNKVVIVSDSGTIASTIEIIKNDVLPLEPSVVVLTHLPGPFLEPGKNLGLFDDINLKQYIESQCKILNEFLLEQMEKEQMNAKPVTQFFVVIPDIHYVATYNTVHNKSISTKNYKERLAYLVNMTKEGMETFNKSLFISPIILSNFLPEGYRPISKRRPKQPTPFLPEYGKIFDNWYVDGIIPVPHHFLAFKILITIITKWIDADNRLQSANLKVMACRLNHTLNSDLNSGMVKIHSRKEASADLINILYEIAKNDYSNALLTGKQKQWLLKRIGKRKSYTFRRKTLILTPAASEFLKDQLRNFLGYFAISETLHTTVVKCNSKQLLMNDRQILIRA